MLVISYTASDRVRLTVNAQVKILDPGSSWVVNEIANLNSLRIAGGTISAPEGYSLTMTVDGVKTLIKAGIHKGKIVLTVTKI